MRDSFFYFKNKKPLNLFYEDKTVQSLTVSAASANAYAITVNVGLQSKRSGISGRQNYGNDNTITQTQPGRYRISVLFDFRSGWGRSDQNTDFRKKYADLSIIVNGKQFDKSIGYHYKEIRLSDRVELHYLPPGTESCTKPAGAYVVYKRPVNYYQSNWVQFVMKPGQRVEDFPGVLFDGVYYKTGHVCEARFKRTRSERVVTGIPTTYTWTLPDTYVIAAESETVPETPTPVAPAPPPETPTPGAPTIPAVSIPSTSISNAISGVRPVTVLLLTSKNAYYSITLGNGIFSSGVAITAGASKSIQITRVGTTQILLWGTEGDFRYQASKDNAVFWQGSYTGTSPIRSPVITVTAPAPPPAETPEEPEETETPTTPTIDLSTVEAALQKIRENLARIQNPTAREVGDEVAQALYPVLTRTSDETRTKYRLTTPKVYERQAGKIVPKVQYETVRYMTPEEASNYISRGYTVEPVDITTPLSGSVASGQSVVDRARILNPGGSIEVQRPLTRSERLSQNTRAKNTITRRFNRRLIG